MMKIRNHILRQYYQNSFGTQSPSLQAFIGSTFDEYYELFRIIFPTSTPRRAALESPESLGFRQLAEALQDDSFKQSDSTPGYQCHARKSELDLNVLAGSREIETLHLDKIREIKNLGALTKIPRLRRLWLIYCGSNHGPTECPASSFEELKLIECDTEFTKVFLENVSTAALHIEHSQNPCLQLAWIRNPEPIRNLTVMAPSISGYYQLPRMQLESLFLANANTSDRLWRNLSNCKDLSELVLAGYAFPPNALPALPALNRITVEAFPEFREEWIEWAANHPHIKCKFPPREVLVPSFEKTMVAEIYRSIDILKIGKGKSPKYRASIITSEIVNNQESLDSTAIEEILREYIRKTKALVDFTAEADEVTIETRTLDNCRSIIDRIIDCNKC